MGEIRIKDLTTASSLTGEEFLALDNGSADGTTQKATLKEAVSIFLNNGYITPNTKKNIALEPGAYLVTISQYGNWTVTSSLYFVVMSYGEGGEASFVQNLANQSTGMVITITLGEDKHSIDITNALGATIFYTIMKIGEYTG